MTRRAPSPPRQRRRPSGPRLLPPTGPQWQPPRRPPRGRRARPDAWRWLLVPPAVLAIGVVAALVLAWLLDSGSPSAGEQAASLAEGPLGSSPRPAQFQSLQQRIPSSYKVVYLVTEPGAPTQYDVREISRPYDGVELTKTTKGVITTGVVSNGTAAYVFVSSPKPHWSELEGGTNRATGDQNPIPALQAGIKYGLDRVIGSGEVLGRPCTVVRTGQPIGSSMTAPTKSAYTDMCLDDSTGMILREIWVYNGKFVRERQAVQLDLAPHFARGTFSVASSGPAVPAGQNGSTITSTLGPAQIAALPAWLPAPMGYRLDGVFDQTQYEDPTGSGTPSPLTEIVAHFVQGPNLIDLKEGNVAPAPAGSIPVSIGHGLRGALTIDMSASYVTTHLPSGLTVRIEGTDIPLLIKAARSLEVRPTSVNTAPSGL